MTNAFDALELVGKQLANRIVMAPMTRSRANGSDATPTTMMATYYAQRASAGLIVTEGIQPCVVGQGYPFTPGLHSDGQAVAWRQVTDAVHDDGGVIFAQLMHCGRIGHPSLLPNDLVPVAPSAVQAKGQVFAANGLTEFVVPEELTAEEIDETICHYASAARNAIAAGFDGVEIHGANGYLIHQFLAANTNLRTDAWGGSPEGRTRFGVEVARAVAEAIGPRRVGFRISPGNPFNDIEEDDLASVYGTLVAQLETLNLAYLHVAEVGDRDLTVQLRKQWTAAFILNPSTDPDPIQRLQLVEDGVADMIAFGATFLANPDLPHRLRQGGPFNTPDPASFYGGDNRGYIDYPTLD